jgi:hypothetical protein
MSKHNVGHAHTSVVFDIQTKTVEELEQIYDIEIGEDGSVYDPCEMREFDSLAAWAMDLEQLEKMAGHNFEKRGGRHAFDDEY